MNAMLRYLFPGRAGAVIRRCWYELGAAMNAVLFPRVPVRALVPVPVRKAYPRTRRPADGGGR